MMRKILEASACAALILVMSACGCSASTDMESGMGSGSPGSSGSSGSSVGSSLATDNTAAGETKIGVGVVTSTGDSEGATADYDGRASFNLTVCALSLDDEDRILDVRFDAVEHEIGFDMAGTLTGDMGADIFDTKVDIVIKEDVENKSHQCGDHLSRNGGGSRTRNAQTQAEGHSERALKQQVAFFKNKDRVQNNIY